MKFGLATSLCIFAVLSTGCGGSSGGGSDPAPITPPVNQSPGGFWSGADSTGAEILAVVTEAGRLHFLVVDDFSQGSGILSVSNGNDIRGNFDLVTQLGFVFPDGTTLASCTLSGTVNERQNMVVTTDCTTTAGLQNQATATLTYDSAYERNSSLATIAGNYQGETDVLNISGAGVIFVQSAVTGCVINGQVSIINSSFNAYDVEFGYSSCIGDFAVLNGSNFTGIAALDNTISPEVLIVAATGEVAGILVSFVQALERI